MQASKYSVLYYKKNNAIGIREKRQTKEHQGKQLFSFGQNTGLSQAQLRKWGDKVLAKLEGGTTWRNVRDWVWVEMEKITQK